MLGDEGEGFTIAMSTLDKGRMSLAAGCVGIAQALPATPPSRYADQRTQFGKPIAGHQLVQQLLADDRRRHRTPPGCWSGGSPT